MSNPAILRGITWGHTRGLVPMQATAQRFAELHPGVEIHWEKRSLKQFEEYPIERLAESYDLLVIDHPFTGYAAEHGIFLPLDDWLPGDFLADQARHSVGSSHVSYTWNRRQWALAIDAAAPVSAWRPDLLLRRGLPAPTTWPEVLALARQGGLEIPAAPIYCLMYFYGFCLAAGATPATSESCIVERSAGEWALATLRELLALCPTACLARSPIQSLELLASAENETLAYCLFPYGYSNYARDGYAAHPLVFGEVPTHNPGIPLTTTLGGTGLAISARTVHPRLAADYAAFVASESIQRTLYTRSGGQPGHRAAWLDEQNNRLTRDFFRQTLPTHDRAFLRPRHPGYLHAFQEPAGPVVHRCLRGEIEPRTALQELDRLHTHSLSVT